MSSLMRGRFIYYDKMSNQGYVKLHRKLQDNPLYKKSSYLHIWIHLLLSCNHKEKEIIWNKELIKIKGGQFITSRIKIAEKTGVPETTIEDILNFFESQQQIRQQKTTKFRVITIKKWSEYQIEEDIPTSKPTTERQQSDNRATQTRMNKNEKNDKEESVLSPKETMILFLENEDNFLKVVDHIVEKKSVQKDIALRELKKFKAYWSEPNASGKKQRWELQKTFELSRRLTTWFSKVDQFKGQKKIKVGII